MLDIVNKNCWYFKSHYNFSHRGHRGHREERKGGRVEDEKKERRRKTGDG
jgi:hypothetical protein